MATKIKIKNFQSIKSVDFEIDGFTVIVGKNNIGKSAVIRAIEAALTNQAGKEFIRHGEKATEVSIKRDNLDIKWEKGASATYKINKEIFTKLNRAIPKPLIDAGFDKMEIGNQKISPIIASQFNALFLIDENGGTITEVLAALYKIDTLSIADDLCQKELRSQKSLKKTRDKDLVDIQSSIEKFKDIEEIKKTVEYAHEKNEEIQKIKKEIELITLYENKMEVLMKTEKVLGPILKTSIPSYSVVEKETQKVNWLKSKSEELEKIVSLNNTLKKVIDVPQTNYMKAEKLFKNTQEIRKINKSFQKAVFALKRLKPIHDVEIPNTSGIKIAQVEFLRSWVSSVVKLKSKIKHIAKFMDTQDFSEDVARIKKAVKVFSEIKKIEGPFFDLVVQTKSFREEEREINRQFDKTKTELSKFKTCPTCERSL